MKPRVLLIAVAAIMTAGAAAYLTQGWLNRQRAAVMASAPKAAKPKPTVSILVAKKALPSGTFVKQADLRWQPWPQGALDPNYILEGKRDTKSFAGAVVRRGILAGEPITDARLVKPGDRGFLAAVLAPGLRAISVPVNATSAIAGLVFPGDRVDLLLSHRYNVINPDDSNKRVTHVVTETVLTNVRVLAIDQSTDDQKKKPDVPKTATIEVTPRQAEMVTTAMDLGKLSLSLRSLARPGTESDDADRTTDNGAFPVIAERGHTLTRDSDVSRVISPGVARKEEKQVVQLMRGSKSAVLEVKK